PNASVAFRREDWERKSVGSDDWSNFRHFGAPHVRAVCNRCIPYHSVTVRGKFDPLRFTHLSGMGCGFGPRSPCGPQKLHPAAFNAVQHYNIRIASLLRGPSVYRVGWTPINMKRPVNWYFLSWFLSAL